MSRHPEAPLPPSSPGRAPSSWRTEPAPQRPLAEDHQLTLGGPGTAFWVILPSFPPSRYMKYLYAYECEKKALSSPAELQAAIDGNRREGRRPSYSSSLFGYSPTTAAGAPALLSPPKIRFPILGLGSSGGTSASGSRISPAAPLRKGLQGSWGRRGTKLPGSKMQEGGRVVGCIQLWCLCQVMESR